MISRRLARTRLLRVWLSLLILGCDSNPEGPHISHPSGAELEKPAADDPPLPKRGRDNPRGVQYAKPD
jgi:hypothetical protein